MNYSCTINLKIAQEKRQAVPMKNTSFYRFYSFLMAILVGLLPIFFVPTLNDPLNNSKLLLFVTASLLTLIGYLISVVKEKTWRLYFSPFSLAAIIFVASAVISSVLNYQYPLEQLVNVGGYFLAGLFILLLAPSLFIQEEHEQNHFRFILNIIALIASIFVILQAFGLGLSPLIGHFSAFQVPNNLSFSLLGSTFLAIQFFSLIFISNILDKKDAKSSLLQVLTLLLSGVALCLSVWAVLPGKVAQFQILPLSASFSMVRTSLSYTQTALLGYGPSAFANAYNLLKPVWLNNQTYWQYTFDSATNWPLTLIITTGLVGCFAWLWFSFQVARFALKHFSEDRYLASFIVGLLVWQFFAPFTGIMFALLLGSISIFLGRHKNQLKEVTFPFNKKAALLPELKKSAFKFSASMATSLVVLLLTTLFIVLGGSYFYRTQVAQAQTYQSNVALTKNDGITAYNALMQARNQDPYSSTIRRNYSLLNLDLALALSNKTDLNAAEKEQALQLVNQAISEANAATVINPYNSQNWLALAEIYLQLLSSSDQAFQQAYLALSQAAAVSPNDPTIRLQLGQLFYSQKQYQQAATFFNQASERKADLPVSYYWLAKSLAEIKQTDDAQAAYVKTLTLLDPSSEDYQTVSKEFENFQAEASAAAKQQANSKTGTQNPENSNTGSPLSNLSENASTESGKLNSIIDGSQINPEGNALPGEENNAAPTPTPHQP